MTKYLTPKDDIKAMRTNKSIIDIVDYVNNMFKTAIDMWASDIHVEPTEDFILIRFRKDWDFLIIDKVDKEFTSAFLWKRKSKHRYQAFYFANKILRKSSNENFETRHFFDKYSSFMINWHKFRKIKRSS